MGAGRRQRLGAGRRYRLRAGRVFGCICRWADASDGLGEDLGDLFIGEALEEEDSTSTEKGAVQFERRVLRCGADKLNVSML